MQHEKRQNFHGLVVPRWNKWNKAWVDTRISGAQVEQAVKFEFSRRENSTLEQVVQAVKFKVLVQNLNLLKITDFHCFKNRLFLINLNFVLVL